MNEEDHKDERITAYVSSPTLKEHWQKLLYNSSLLGDSDGLSRYQRFHQFFLNMLIKDVYHNNLSPLAREFKQVFPDDYKLVEDIALQFKEHLDSLMLGVEFLILEVCFEDNEFDSVKLRIKPSEL